MIHIFNRKELLITWSMTELANIRDILASSGYPKSSGALLILQPMTHGELLRRFLIYLPQFFRRELHSS